MPDLNALAAKVTLFVLDIDGVLTNACVYYSPDGELLKRFSMRDGHGLVMCREAGIEIAFLTRETSPFVEQRAKKLKIKHVVSGCLDKGPAIAELAAKLGRTAEQTAYMGDDVIDYDALQWAGLAACPADAEREIKEICDIIAEREGGNGAVRDVCNLLLANR